MNELNYFSIICGIIIGLLGIGITFCGNIVQADIGVSICVYITAYASGMFITYGITKRRK